MKWSNLNPTTWINRYIQSTITNVPIAADPTTKSLTPVPNTPTETEPDAPGPANGHIVQGTFIDNTSVEHLIGNITTNTEHQRKLVESFDEDRETFIERAVRTFYMGVFYVLPLIIAWYVGTAIGDGFAGNQAITWSNGWNAFNHVISWAIEFSISGLVLAGSITARKIKGANSEYILPFLLTFAALLFFTSASGIAQYILVEAHLHPTTGAEHVAAILRVSAGPAVDISALLFLSVMRFKSLKKYLHDQEQKRQAIHAASQSEIALQTEQVQAALNMQSALSDLQTKAQRAQVWNQLEAMQSQSMIENARRKMQDSSEGSYYRRSRY